MADDNNGRTHEPNLREITAELDGLAQLGEERYQARKDFDTERDRRYEQRFQAQETAVAAALLAAKELNNLALSAADKAVAKAEQAQTAYNERSNEFRAALDDGQKLQLPRAEADVKFANIEEKITSLRETRSEGVGRIATIKDNRAQSNFTISQAIAVASIVIGAALYLALH